MKDVFLSYRRSDSRHLTGRIYDHLRRALRGGHIFRDVDSIPLGVDFRRVLDTEVGCCDVFVAVIGASWLSSIDESGNRRLDDPNDFVRIEIESAIERGMPMLVALSEEGQLPAESQLPASLRTLANCRSIRLRSDAGFRSDVTELIRAIRRCPPPPRRVGSVEDRWRAITDRVVAWSLIGFLAGLLTGVGLIVGCDWMGLPRTQAARLITYTVIASICGGVVGFRGAGLLGAASGLVLSPIAAVLFWVIQMVASILLVGLILMSLGKKLAGPDEVLVLACGSAGTVAAMFAVLLMAKRRARRPSRRGRSPFPVVRLGLTGIFVAILCGVLLGAPFVALKGRDDYLNGEQVEQLEYVFRVTAEVMVLFGLYGAVAGPRVMSTFTSQETGGSDPSARNRDQITVA